VTTPTGCARKRRSRIYAALLRSRPAAGAPTATDSTVAATAVQTTPSTSSSLAGYVTTPVPGPTPPGAPPKGCPNPRSSDASSATSPARSSPPSPPAQQAINPTRPKRCQRRLDNDRRPSPLSVRLATCRPTGLPAHRDRHLRRDRAVLRVRRTAQHPSAKVRPAVAYLTLNPTPSPCSPTPASI
jgi:hypothetical protein